jgi:hypothetical protein
VYTVKRRISTQGGVRVSDREVRIYDLEKRELHSYDPNNARQGEILGVKEGTKRGVTESAPIMQVMLTPLRSRALN